MASAFPSLRIHQCTKEPWAVYQPAAIHPSDHQNNYIYIFFFVNRINYSLKAAHIIPHLIPESHMKINVLIQYRQCRIKSGIDKIFHHI